MSSNDDSTVYNPSPEELANALRNELSKGKDISLTFENEDGVTVEVIQLKVIGLNDHGGYCCAIEVWTRTPGRLSERCAGTIAELTIADCQRDIEAFIAEPG